MIEEMKTKGYNDTSEITYVVPFKIDTKEGSSSSNYETQEIHSLFQDQRCEKPELENLSAAPLISKDFSGLFKLFFVSVFYTFVLFELFGNLTNWLKNTGNRF